MNLVRIIIPYSLFVFCTLFYGCVSFLKDIPNCKQILMEIQTMPDAIILNYGDHEVMFPPCIYCPEEYMDNIFAVPEKNAVGTNDIDNAVSVLHFKNDSDLNRKVVKKDFMEMVTGPFQFRFLPVWSEKEIAYSQTRGFLLVNIPDKKVEIHTVCPGIEDEIGGLTVLDESKRIFVFEILKPYAKIQGFEKVLRVARFDNNTFSILSEHPAGNKTLQYSEPWFTYQNHIFIYNDSTTIIEAFDNNFKSVSHPLSDVFNENKSSFRCLREITIHPFLPVALVVERGKWPTKEQLSKFNSLPALEQDKATDILFNEARRRTLYLFRWTDPDPKRRLIPLVSSAGSIWNSYNPENAYSHFTFSPDGKWVVFHDDSEDSDNPVFVAIPIDEKNPLLLGKPIKLGKATREGSTGPTGTAWTTDPTAFVMCDGAVLYRWVLDDIAKMRRETVPKGIPDPWMKGTR